MKYIRYIIYQSPKTPKYIVLFGKYFLLNTRLLRLESKSLFSTFILQTFFYINYKHIFRCERIKKGKNCHRFVFNISTLKMFSESQK